MTTTATSAVHPDADTAHAAAREAALGPFARPGRRYWLLVAALTAVVGVGLVAWSVQLRDGMRVAGYNDEAFWALYIADVVTFIGVSYGGAVISAVLRLTGAEWRAPLTRLAEGTAVVTVLIGGAFIVPHLGRPDRIWELVLRPNLSSPVFWDFVAIGTYTVASIVFFALPLLPDFSILDGSHADRLGWRRRIYRRASGGWTGAPHQKRALNGALGLIAILIIPLAVSVHSVLSWAFSLTSRPWWHESIWAPYFVVAALYSGVALVILVVAGFRRAYHLEQFITERHFTRLGYILATFAAAYLYLTFADILPDAYVGEREPSAVMHELLAGHFAVSFWLFVVAAGILPLLIVALPRTRTVPGIVVASAVIAPAMWLKRMLMVVAPATYDRVTGVFGSYHFTWVSISVTLAGVAAIPLLLMLMFRIVPLLPLYEMQEIAESAREHDTAAPDPAERATPTEPQAPARPRRRLLGGAGVILLVAAGVASLVVVTTRPAAAAAKPTPAHLQLAATTSGSQVLLTATVTGPHTGPLNRARVQLFAVTREFGPDGELVLAGTVTTDATGSGTLAYRSPVTGNEQFVARYAGSPLAGAASVTTSVTITAASPVYRGSAPKPLATAGKIAVTALLAAVAAVWLTLIAQVRRVRRACRII